MSEQNYTQKLERLEVDMLLKRITRILIAVGFVFIILEFILHRYGNVGLEDLPLFPPVFALIGTIVMTGLGFILQLFLGRPSEYYLEADNE